MKLPVEGFNEKQTDVMSQVKLVPLMTMMVMVMMSVINAESVFVLLSSSWRWTFIIQEVKNRLESIKCVRVVKHRKRVMAVWCLFLSAD